MHHFDETQVRRRAEIALREFDFAIQDRSLGRRAG